VAPTVRLGFLDEHEVELGVHLEPPD